MNSFKQNALLVIKNWERIIFSLAGLALLGYSLFLIYGDKVTNAAVVFGLGFLSFIYANLARFKRFKGLGFEGELWEDKQKEAADLIERLKNVVAIYTREVIIGKVSAGRWGSGADWESHWKLYDDLVNQHAVLGQKIDFSDVKKTMDDYFLFDLSSPHVSAVTHALNSARSMASQSIDREFGSPIKDAEGYGERLDVLRSIKITVEDSFNLSAKSNLAQFALDTWHKAAPRFLAEFKVEAKVDQKHLDRLQLLAEIYNQRPVNVTEMLLAWSKEKQL